MFRNLLTTPYLPDIGGRGGIKMVSASTPSANEPGKDLILVHILQLELLKKHKSQEEWYLVVRISIRFSTI